MVMKNKPKKPARIKGRVVYALEPVKNSAGRTLRFSDRPKYIELLIDNPDALVEQVARAMLEERWSCLSDNEKQHYWEKYGKNSYSILARAALRSIGVPLKKSESNS